MAQFCNCARLALAHALLFVFSKASLGFFGVVDSVSCLDSVFESKLSKLESNLFLDSESTRDSVKLDSKPTLDSESALHSALGLPYWRGVDSVSSLLQAKKLVIAVWLCKLCGFFGRLADLASVPSEKSAILSHCIPKEPFSMKKAQCLNSQPFIIIL